MKKQNEWINVKNVIPEKYKSSATGELSAKWCDSQVCGLRKNRAGWR